MSIKGKSAKVSVEELRERLAGKPGGVWKSFEQLADTDEFKQWVDDEFPHRGSLLELNRRDLLKFMGASMALAGLGGCRSLVMEKERVVPFVRQPEELVPGKPLYYRTAMPRPGGAIGLEVESREGRPIKIEGNPDHPASLGACDPFALASILTLYDPDRSGTVMFQGDIETWESYIGALQDVIKRYAPRGEGLAVLTETVYSPTLKRQLDGAQRAMPGMRWVQWDPLNRWEVYEGARLFAGRALQPIYDLSKAKVVLSVDADFVVSMMPGSIAYARQMMDGRRLEKTDGQMNRLYAVQTNATVNGATADHCQPMTLSEMRKLLNELVTGSPGSSFGRALAADMRSSAGACAVVPGDHLPAEIHYLAHLANARFGAIGNTVSFVEPAEARVEDQRAGLKLLSDDMLNGRIKALLVLGSNPAYNAPADVGFEEALQAARASGTLKGTFHHGLYVDETASLCDWHAPEAHFLESWSDVRAYDGTVSIVQPLIDPIFESRSPHQLFSLLLRKPQLAMDTIRETWTQLDDRAWRKALHEGIVPDSRRAAVAMPTLGDSVLSSTAQPSEFEVHFRPDPTIGDGRWANIGWLQELPKPLTKIVWDNVVHVSPATATDLGLSNEDHVRIEVEGRAMVGPVWIVPGHADRAATVFLGYGRTKGGVVTLDEQGRPRGYDAYSIQSSAQPWVAAGRISKAPGTTVVALTQDHNSMEGRDIVRSGTLAEFSKNPNFDPRAGEEEEGEPPNLYNKTKEWAKENPDLPQWGMSIDLNTCIGCNACVTACQAENNIPVVGKEQVTRGREMHWIRIDRYYGPKNGKLDLDNPQTYFQPVTCMHCETAPCEPVCPVGATVHSHEGLNQMVYNRCVGTRYCSNNCPYKVRRFNYLNFQYQQPNFKKEQDIPLLKLINNPDVTVRSRGVMEKCTYCVQRINSARINAKLDGRPIADGEVVTACQQACPTRAIVFGNIADGESDVYKLRENARRYDLLADLNTFPRTTYLAKVRNPNPALEEEVAG